MQKLKAETKAAFFNENGKMNNWIARKGWISKNGFDDLKSRIDSVIPDDIPFKEKVFVVVLHDGVRPRCLKCGNFTTYYASYSKFASYCSKECESSSKERSQRARENIRVDLLREGMVKKYGVDNCMKIDEYKEKVRNTSIERYGCDNPAKSEEVREKISKATRGSPKTFNGKKPQHSKLTDEQVWALNNLKEIQRRHLEENIPITVLSNQLGFSNSTLLGAMVREGLEYKVFGKTSYQEEVISNFLTELGVEFIRNDRTVIKPKEVDIYVPSHNLGIEVDGLFWHNSERVGSNHMLDKTNAFPGKMIHLYDIELTEKLPICKSIIRNSLGLVEDKLNARDTTFRTVQHKDYVAFCEENHIHGSRVASMIGGLYADDRLMAVMSFNRTGEMVRFCSKLNTSIRGGASKLLKNCLKTFNLSDVYTFADLRFGDGKTYESIGFECVGDTKPNYWYFNQRNYKLHSRIAFQKHKLKDLLEKFDPELSEWENMKANGWLRVYDCGSRKYVLK